MRQVPPPAKPTSSQSKKTALRSSNENPLSSTGFSFHPNDPYAPSIFQARIKSPKQVNANLQTSPRGHKQQQITSHYHHNHSNQRSPENRKLLFGPDASSNTYIQIYQQHQLQNQQNQNQHQKKNFSATGKRRLISLGKNSKNQDLVQLKDGNKFGKISPNTFDAESMIQPKSSNKTQVASPRMNLSLNYKTARVNVPQSNYVKPDSYLKRDPSITLNSQFFGLPDQHDHLIDNNSLLGELKDLIHKKRENKLKSFDLGRIKLQTQSKTFRNALQNNNNRKNNSNNQSTVQHSKGNLTPKSALMQDLQFEMRSWKKDVSKKRRGTGSILLGNEQEFSRSKYNNAPATPTTLFGRGERSFDASDITTTRAHYNSTQSQGGGGGMLKSRLKGQLPDIIKKINQRNTPNRSTFLSKDSIDLQGAANNGESVFSISLDGTISILAGDYYSCQDKMESLAKTLNQCVTDGKRRQKLARQILGSQRGSIQKNLLNEADNRHFDLMEQMKELKDLKMELGMNFDLIKNLNSSKGLANIPVENIVGQKDASSQSLQGLRLLLNQKVSFFLSQTPAQTNDFMRNGGIQNQIMTLNKVFRTCLRSIHQSPMTQILNSLFIIEEAWKVLVYCFQSILGNQAYQVEKDTQEYKRNLEEKRDEMKSKVQDLKITLKRKCEEYQEIIRLNKLTIDRLIADKEHAIQVIHARDVEIKRLKQKREGQPHQLTDFLAELEKNLTQTIDQRKSQMQAMGFMADICTVEEGIGKLSPVWKKKREKLKRDATSYIDQQRIQKNIAQQSSTGYDSPVGAIEKSPSKSRMSQFMPVERNDGLSQTPRGNQKVLSFFNPYIQKLRQDGSLMTNQQSETSDFGIAELIEKLFANMLDDDEQQALKHTLMGARNELDEDYDKKQLDIKQQEDEDEQNKRSIQAKKIDTKQSDYVANVLTGTQKALQLLKIQEKFFEMKKIIHKIWQNLKFHQNQMRKALQHQDEQLALLLNPVDKSAPVQDSTQTALRLNPKSNLDYSPFAGAMVIKSQQESSYQSKKKSGNPLLVILNTHRHKSKKITDRRGTIMDQAVGVQQQGVVYAFLLQSIEQKTRNDSLLITSNSPVQNSSVKKFSILQQQQDYAHFFYDYLVIQFGLKTQAIKHFHLVYKTLRFLLKAKDVLVGKDFLNIMGIGERQLNLDQENLVIKAILIFKQMYGKLSPSAQPPKPVADSGVPQINNKVIQEKANQMIQLMSLTPEDCQRYVDFFQNGEVGLFQITERIKKFGLLQGDLRSLGMLILENIRSDKKSYLPKIRKLTEDNLDDDQKQNDEDCSSYDHKLNIVLAKMDIFEEKLKKNHRKIYETIDKDRVGSISRQSFRNYYANVLGVNFTSEEFDLLYKFFDPMNLDMIMKDDFSNYFMKVKQTGVLKAYQRMSLHGFIQMLLDCWHNHRKNQQINLLDLFNRFDENHDHVLSLQEFQKMLRSIEPQMKTGDIVKIYRQTLEMEQATDDLDKMSPSAFCNMAFSYKLGGHGKEIFQNYTPQT